MPSIFIFTWNTQTVRFADPAAQSDPTLPPADFIDPLISLINEKNCDLVVIALQEDSIRDSPIVEVLEKKLSDKYTRAAFTELSGYGSTTIKAAITELAYRPRGIRLAIFKKNALELISIESAEFVCPSIIDWLTCGKGGVAINLTTNNGSFTFLNVHLPFTSSTLIKSYDRPAGILWQLTCLNYLYDKVIEKFDPDYLFLCGDLNFRVQGNLKAREIADQLFVDPDFCKKILTESDELRLLLQYKCGPQLPAFIEGIDNAGPQFLPTCKLVKGRKNTSSAMYRCGTKNHRPPSWCDRILYMNRVIATSVQCTEYNRFDILNMNLSDHAAVYATFKGLPAPLSGQHFK